MMVNRLRRWERWEGYDRARDPVAESIVPLRKNMDRNWQIFNDRELLEHANWRFEKDAISTRYGLVRIDPGLYRALNIRKLLNEVNLPDSQKDYRNWASIDTVELGVIAKRLIAERGIKGRAGLRKADCGLHDALLRRKLLDEVGLASSQESRREWAATTDENIIRVAKRFIAEKGIGGKRELWEKDGGLYQTLLKRKLLGRIGLDNKRRNWASMGDEELVVFAREFLKENGISGRWGLERADHGLHKALLIREKKSPGIRERVFSDAESVKHENAVIGVLDALDSFGDDK